MIIRSKAKYIREGEKNSRYFASLEKRHYTDKSISLLEKSDSTIVLKPDEILNVTKEFYESLYSSKEDSLLDVNLAEILDGPILSDQERQSLEGLITLPEALSALKKMDSNKSPGSDGFSSEFYTFFWSDLGVFLVRSFNHSFLIGELSSTQKQGIITCLPKEGKSKRFIQNWRPITLLNTSYKIASSVIAERIKSVLLTIIHSSQNGFISGRNIGNNLRLIYDILVYTDLNNIPGQLLLVDFEKAFDSVAWSFIDKCLDFFNFGPNLKHWIKTFYSNINSCVAVNGQYSSWFPIQRGCRQGDPCSPYIFLICAEILSLLLRNNENIKGINIGSAENPLISQFADDATLFLDGSRKSFEHSIKTLNYFASISGLGLNIEKTQVVWIGSMKNSTIKYLENVKLKWNPESFKVLGVIFSTNIENIVQLNYNNKEDEIKRLLRTWSKRHLTPYGKITVIKTLVLPKLVYLFCNIPDPPDTFIQTIDKMFFEFLWDYKPSKVKKSVVCSPYENGGLRMIDLKSFLASMKISWVKRIITDDNQVPNALFIMSPDLKLSPIVGSDDFHFANDLKNNAFWADVFKHYKNLHLKTPPRNGAEFLAENINCNPFITIGQKTILNNNLVEKNILKISDLVKPGGSFYAFYEIRRKFNGLEMELLFYLGLVSSIKSFKRKYKITLNDNKGHQSSNLNLILTSKDKRATYKSLTTIESKPSCENK